MITIDKIHERKEYLVKTLYSKVREEQRLDDEFYKDTFSVPQIRNPLKIQRTGRAARLIDAPAEHIVTSNPIAFRKSIKDSQEVRDASLRVSSEVNRWINIMKRQNPNPFKEFYKNLLLRGEAWVHPIHNERWVVSPIQRKGMPVLFIIPDPMNVYASPNEDENGIPEYVIVVYESLPWIIKSKYPQWTNPLKAGEKKATVSWLEYWDNENFYFEADEEPVLKGQIKKNLYGFTPFVHKLSGFGKSSPEGKMEDLIVGRLRKSRNILIRECALVSDIDNTFHMFANKNITVQPIDDDHKVPENFSENYELGYGLVQELPFGIKVEPSVSLLPEPQIFTYLYSVEAELERENPSVLAGIPIGSSARQQDMTSISAMRRYETLMENGQYAFATALGFMGLQIIEKIPTLFPTEYGLKMTDLHNYYEVDIQLRVADPIEDDRKATLGSRLYQSPRQEIDLRTNLIEYQGRSAEKAEEIITNLLVEKVTLQNPDIAELMGLRVIEKAGMTEELAALKARGEELKKQQKGLESTPTGVKRAMGEVETELGREMAPEGLRGARASPERYIRE